MVMQMIKLIVDGVCKECPLRSIKVLDAIADPIALALGNLIDPPATMVNASGDYVVSFIVSRYVDGKDWLQKQLNK